MSLTEHQVVAVVERLSVTRLRAWVGGGLVRPPPALRRPIPSSMWPACG